MYTSQSVNKSALHHYHVLVALYHNLGSKLPTLLTKHANYSKSAKHCYPTVTCIHFQVIIITRFPSPWHTQLLRQLHHYVLVYNSTHSDRTRTDRLPLFDLFAQRENQRKTSKIDILSTRPARVTVTLVNVCKSQTACYVTHDQVNYQRHHLATTLT